VGSLVHRRVTAADVELLQLVSQRVAIAIERAQLHEETLQLDQLRLNFVAIASHELRTPATSVYGALTTLVERRGLPSETREVLLVTAQQQSDRMRRLIEQLLDLSRLDARGLTVEPRPIVLNDLLAEIAAGAAADGLPIRLDVQADLAVVADPLVLERVVSNLLTNAIRHGAAPIRISAEQQNGSLRVSVEDEGGGVPEELRGRLFEPFTRIDTGRGSGLGLAIARAYARAHGGELLYVDGERGTRFDLILPQD
jgi:signal transduction histidine kinase